MYYLLLDDDTEKDAIYDTNVLGEESFGVFYPSVGFTAFNNIIRKHPDLVDNVKIYDGAIIGSDPQHLKFNTNDETKVIIGDDDTKKSYTISEFISVLEEFKIKSA